MKSAKNRNPQICKIFFPRVKSSVIEGLPLMRHCFGYFRKKPGPDFAPGDLAHAGVRVIAYRSASGGVERSNKGGDILEPQTDFLPVTVSEPMRLNDLVRRSECSGQMAGRIFECNIVARVVEHLKKYYCFIPEQDPFRLLAIAPHLRFAQIGAGREANKQIPGHQVKAVTHVSDVVRSWGFAWQ
jgi:hypothetical protein